ncbi:putative membrane protein YfhO [Clostridium punense]|uniref:Membrane protein YfhO n=1 Tax=Clostridium punense TaxID=1054297 RepID=A0ABS4K4Y5_9CLOT|nr:MULTISPECIES: YfhO family protein [Clostridium]EQB87825.1 hypothetical protein M918_07205 [Clostridium sp. BL8]MBP2022320.1 putative membrane protein YfhO [Clostridium punense]
MKVLDNMKDKSSKIMHDLYNKGKDTKLLTFGIYTVLFCIIFLFSYIGFWQNGKSFVWAQIDGTTQHYPALIYLGKYFRKIIRGFLAGNFVVPMFDFNLGMGSDIIQTFHYYGLGDPLMLLSAVVPVKYSVYLYNGFIILRTYLSGITFLSMCFYFKKEQMPSVSGALIYVFSGFAVFSGIRHPYFINPMIYLPLIIIGLDKVLKKEKPHLFITMIFISAISSFYFFYMITVFIFIYAIVRFFDLVKENRVKELCAAFFRCVIFYIAGVLMAGIIFIPVVIGFLNSGRSKDSPIINLFSYDVEGYKNIFIKFLGPPFNWEYLGMAAIVLFCIVIMFTRRNHKYRTIRVLFLILSIFSIVPFFSYMMNGFGYVSGRWTFGFALLISFIVVEYLPYIFQITLKEKGVLFFVVCLYGTICITDKATRNVSNLFSLAMLALCFVVILLLQHEDNKKSFRYGYSAIALFIGINLIANCNFLFSPTISNYISQFENQKQVLGKIFDTPASSALPIPKGEFYRIDSSTNIVNNIPAIREYPGISIYYSLVNSSLADMHYELENWRAQPLFNISGVDARSAIETLSSVRYFSLETGRNDNIPFGFVESYSKQRGKKTDVVYENRYALPLGYTYSSFTSMDKYSQLNGLEKQDSMMQSVALPKRIEGFTEKEPNITLKKLEYEIEASKGVRLEDGKLVVSQDNAQMNIKFKGIENSETYIRFKNLEADDSPFYASINFQDGGKNFKALEKQSPWYFGQKNYSINLGYRTNPLESIIVTFPKRKTINLEDIEIYCQPMDNYPINAELLKSEPLENIKVLGNTIEGTVDLSSNKILCISIPWNSGWKAKVDGKDVEILKANNMFMGIPLVNGHHEVSLSYTTPGLKLGALSSLIGLIIFLVVVLGYKNKSNLVFKYKKK